MAALTQRPRSKIGACFAPIGALALVVLVAASGCSDPSTTPLPTGSGVPAAKSADPTVGSPRTVLSLLDTLSECDVDHRGLLLDLGSSLSLGRVRPIGDGQLAPVERDGSSWLEVTGKGLEASFVMPEPQPVFAQLRIESNGAKSARIELDDVSLGTLKLDRTKPSVVTTNATGAPVDAGEHTLRVQLSGGDATRPVRARIDWLRIGVPDELRTTYGPPIASDLVTPAAALDKVPHRALSLRIPSLVRCPLLVPTGAELRVAVGMLGSAKGEVEVVVRGNDPAPITLLRREVVGGQGAKWSDLSLSLDAFAGQLVQLELRAPQGSPTGRVLFGDPEIVVPDAENRATPEAQLGVVIVLSAIDRARLPTSSRGPTDDLPNFARLSAQSALFLDHRAPTTVVPGVIATLTTGRSPLEHGLTDYGARLGAKVPSLFTAARRVGVETGLFTAVPHSFEPSGLPQGAERVVVSSPVSGEARDPIEEATDWFRETIARDPGARALAIVHARGAHPPWSILPKQLDALPPANYTGELHPRRAAQQLGQLRRRKGALDLTDADRERLDAMVRVSLATQDRAFGELVRWLESSGLRDRSLIVVTGDVASELGTLFADDPPLDEAALALPLRVAFPGGAHAGSQSRAPTEVADVAGTLAAALRIPLETQSNGLVAKLLDRSGTVRPRLAASGEERSLRLERWILRKAASGKATLCDQLLDATCSYDRRPGAPFVAHTLERILAALEARAAASRSPREPIELDDATLAALRVWGSMQ